MAWQRARAHGDLSVHQFQPHAGRVFAELQELAGGHFDRADAGHANSIAIASNDSEERSTSERTQLPQTRRPQERLPTIVSRYSAHDATGDCEATRRMRT